MKYVHCADWCDTDEIEITEVIKYEVLVTFGGGMGGANITYYSKDIMKSTIIDNENYISIDHFGDIIELNLAHVVELKKCLVIEMLNKTKNSFRVFKVGRIDTNYEIVYRYTGDWYKSLLYEIKNLETDTKDI
jgi:hypothetical protein